MTTEHRWRLAAAQLACALALMALGAGGARADLTATYDGSLVVKASGEVGVIAGSLVQAGSGLSGTVAMEMVGASESGVYFVSGRVRGQGRKVALVGANASGVQLRWKGRVKGDVIRGKARLRGPGHRMKGRLELLRRTLDPPVSPPVSCDNAFFTGQVMGLVLQPVCAGCHVEGGSAQSASFRVTPGDPLATQESVALHVNKAQPDESRILQKPLGRLPHSGGVQLVEGSEAYDVLSQWVTLVATDRQCDAQPDKPMVPLAPTQLAIRASMDLRGTRPSLADLDAIEADPAAYETLVDRYLASPEFLDRVKDVYDDALLVRREDFSDESRDETAAIYGEALELIAYIVDNDRPFTEIGTAHYTVANDLFQRDPERMPYPMHGVSGSAWQTTRYADGRPHAGILSTSAFWEVWDTNNTNINRRRANRLSIVFHCYNFLDTPVDVTRDVDNADAGAVLDAVTTRPDCKACHDRLDPLASFLFPLDNADQLENGNAPNDEFYSGNPERWRTANRRPPSVYGVPGLDLVDLGRLLTDHPSFAECQTKRAFSMLFLRDPRTTTELNSLAEIAAAWRTEDGYNYRKLVRRWLLSDAYRNRPADDDPAWVRRTSPERLERVIEDLTGFVWAREPEDDQDDGDPESDPPRTEPVPLLTSEEDGFKIILGGINGVNVSGRSTSLNASVVNVQRKVATLAADHVVRTDLALSSPRRRLLHGVTGVENPMDDDARIRNVVVSLMRRLYGERVTTDAPVVDAWVQLWAALWADDTQSGDGSNEVPGTQSERAWRGLLTAMLRSPKILLY